MTLDVRVVVAMPWVSVVARDTSIALNTSVALNTRVALDTVFVLVTRVSMVTTDSSMLILVLGTAWMRKGLAQFDGGKFGVG